MFHTTKDGRKLPISEMDDAHLLNTVRRQNRRACEGVQVMVQDYGPETIYGREALELFNHQDYLDELRKRGLTP